MSDIQVSLFGPAIHTDKWPAFFEQLTMNTVSYEIIFAGPIVPTNPLPPNVKFIHRFPDPGLGPCAQTAANACSGETILLMADDILLSPFFLDKMYETYKRENDYKCMVFPRWCGDVTTRAANSHAELNKEHDITEIFWETYLIAGRDDIRWGFPFRSKQLWKEVGGFDRRFVGAPHDADWLLRAYMYGARFVYAYDAFMSEPLGPESRAWNRWNGLGEVNELMWRRWYSNGQFTGGVLLPAPRTPFEPYPEGELPQNTTWRLEGDKYVQR